MWPGTPWQPGRGGDTGVAIAALTTIDDDRVQSDLAQFLHLLLRRPSPRFRCVTLVNPALLWSWRGKERHTLDCVIDTTKQIGAMLDACQA